jgi:hypothetical protein
MRKRTLGNAAIVATALATAIGLGVAVASAATSQPGATASASAAPSASGSGPAASASPSVSSSSDGSKCAEVYLVTSPADDSAGKLCTAVTASGTSISGVAITFTPSSSCDGSVDLRVSGLDQDNAEFADIKTVTCTSGTATASFDPVSEVAPDTNICGLLLSDTYTAAQACVPIS